MNNHEYKVIKNRTEPYCENYTCPRISKRNPRKGKCDRCPKGGTILGRIGIHRARLQSKRELRQEIWRDAA